MNFMEKLRAAVKANRSLLCIGLDPDPLLMPEMDLLAFNKGIVDATADLVCAYKPNLAFYEALGLEGIEALKKTVSYIPEKIPVIADAKRGDVGHTAKAYARALFEALGFDAATVNPYLGFEAMKPFIEYVQKGIFVLCRTSNPGSGDIQLLSCGEGSLTRPLYELVAEQVRGWNRFGNLGLVVGATQPRELERLRQICPELPFLIPGIGAQGGDLEATVRYGVGKGGTTAIISSSRQILYASRGKDFALAARREGLHLREEINRMLAQVRNQG